MRTKLLLAAPIVAMILAVALPGVARARALVVIASAPAAGATIDGPGPGFFVRFDGPVNHRESALLIVRGGQVTATLRPLLDSAPNELFAHPGTLAGGDYELRWVVRSMPDGEVSQGSIAFSVKR